MSLKLNLANINEHKKILLGRVKKVIPGTGRAEDKCISIVIEGTQWNRDTENEETKEVTISFFNTETANMMDRVINAGVSEGHIITVEVFEKNGNYYGNNFKYKGHWVVPANESRKEKNIFIGTVASPFVGENKNGNKMLRISMADNTKKDEETKWAKITFVNKEDSNIADRAIRVLTENDGKNVRTDKDGKKIKIVAICSPGSKYNDQDYYFGNEFIVISDMDKSK